MKKITKLLFIIGSFLFVVSGCSSNSSQDQASAAYHKISAEEAKTMMDEKEVIIVDVRTLAEYDESHIPDAISVPNETIDQEAKTLLPDKDAVYLLHCRTGVRSKQASDKLVKLGYTQIYDFGGIVEWPYEVTSTQK